MSEIEEAKDGCETGVIERGRLEGFWDEVERCGTCGGLMLDDGCARCKSAEAARQREKAAALPHGELLGRIAVTLDEREDPAHG